jgi:hypothetical protein
MNVVTEKYDPAKMKFDGIDFVGDASAHHEPEFSDVEYWTAIGVLLLPTFVAVLYVIWVLMWV